MSELNGNEKYFRLPTRLTTDAANPGTIQNGDLMLYGADSLVLFYKTFQTSYSSRGSGGSTTQRVSPPQSVPGA